MRDEDRWDTDRLFPGVEEWASSGLSYRRYGRKQEQETTILMRTSAQSVRYRHMHDLESDVPISFVCNSSWCSLYKTRGVQPRYHMDELRHAGDKPLSTAAFFPFLFAFLNLC
ncbi:hypothetical protein J6590_015329 [Homalodisca vitripennis]|nr:hypothetical protein J6590_015329 [Homalodisca vitripennis]